ncbi:MAG TPA: class I SAM-dependent methyltransferase [Gammaproteobacteria bacterium]|nr:class I SAM-dependent methyltransferase [Gammaproteobacteria bacterium]
MIDIPENARPGIRWRPNGLAAHELPRPKHLIEVDVVLDLGCGIRPIDWYEPEHHVCVDAHKPYLDRIRATGEKYECVHANALDALRNLKPGVAGAIYCLDMIEHMTREGGAELLRLMLLAQPKQIVVFTPNGFLAQDGPDPWGLGGETWQKHRSGWTQEDFPATDWWIEYYGRGFLATWTNGFASLLTN